MDAKKFWKEAQGINDEESFNRLAIQLFKYQSNHVPVYKQFLKLLNFKIANNDSQSKYRNRFHPA